MDIVSKLEAKNQCDVLARCYICMCYFCRPNCHLFRIVLNALLFKQVMWLKVELCKLLEEKRSAVVRFVFETTVDFPV